MKVQSTFELLLDVNSFNNVDLFSQGIYLMRFKLAMDNSEIKQSKYPNSHSGRARTSLTQHTPSTISSSPRHFRSASVTRSSSQKMPASTKLNSKQTIIFQNLFYCEKQVLNSKSKNEPIFPFMVLASSQSFKVSLNINGVQEHIPLVFDEQHFSLCNLYVHTVLIDFKLISNQSIEQNILTQHLEILSQQFANYQKLILSYQPLLPEDFRKNLIKQISKIPSIIKSKNEQLSNLSEAFQQVLLLSYNNEQSNSLGQSIYSQWLLYQEIVKEHRKVILAKINEESPRKLKASLAKFIVKTNNPNPDVGRPIEDDYIKQQEENAKLMRAIPSQLTNIVEFYSFETPCKQAFLFEQSYVIQQIEPVESKSHIIVMVHGYQGSSYDFRLWRNYLRIKFPLCHLLASSVNENDTEGDIWQMGINLAQEVTKFITNQMKKHTDFKLSFLGHSLGGVLIRIAIIHLQKYHSNFHSLVTLATPHVGISAQQSKLVGTGLFFMKLTKQGDNHCLSQLTLSDNSKLEATLLYKLSLPSHSRVEHFKNVVLAYSLQDSYVPFQSATLTRVKKSFWESESSLKSHNQMVDSLLATFKCERFVRVGVQFHLDKKTLESMIGRTAHVEFLENNQFIRLFVDSYYEIYQ